MNLAPFITAILALFINKEAINKFTIVCIVGSFSGVVLIALANKNKEKDSLDDEDSTTMNKINNHTSSETALGLIFMFVVAFLYSLIIILTRKMKGLHFTLVMFHYGLCASGILLVWLIIHYLTNLEEYPNGPRLLTYDRSQWFQLIAIAVINSVGMNF